MWSSPERTACFQASICKTEGIQFLLVDPRNVKEAHACSGKAPSITPGNYWEGLWKLEWGYSHSTYQGGQNCQSGSPVRLLHLDCQVQRSASQDLAKTALTSTAKWTAWILQTLSGALERARCPPPRKLQAHELLGQCSFVLCSSSSPWSVWPVSIRPGLFAEHWVGCVEDKGLTSCLWGL